MKWFLVSVLIVVAVVWVTGVFDRPEPGLPGDSMTESKSPVAKVPFHPNAVLLPFLPSVPGGIVCSKFDDVVTVIDLYGAYWNDVAMDKATNGQTRIMHGAPGPAPDPHIFGCALLKAGTPVHLDSYSSGIPIVTILLPDGTVTTGVTHPAMIAKQIPQP